MSGRNNSLYLQDILDSVDAIESYTAGMTFEMFRLDRMCYSATIREFEIIGEAVNHLGEDVTMEYPEIQWRDIVDFRNILVMPISVSMLILSGMSYRMTCLN